MALFNTRGFALPQNGTLKEMLELKNFEETIKSNLRIILGTVKGEVVGEPDFGTRLFNLVHELNDDTIQSIAATYIIEDIAKYEPRVFVKNVDFVAYEHTIKCSIKYTIKLDPNNLIHVIDTNINI